MSKDTKSAANPKVDWFFEKDDKWHDEYAKLRAIMLDCGLTEELKWGQPCYMAEDSNIVLIHGFKDYCALLFFKGSLMKDPDGILVQQTKNVQAARQIRFTNEREIKKTVLKSYIAEAIALEKSGAKVAFKETKEFEMPEEFQRKLDNAPALKVAFGKLTPGRQRAYLLFFSSAKQAKTREARIEKYVAQILDGKGMDDE
jgi:uncharacterized protein YdeI (YjbR/CyaY-like superfamily)